MVSITPETSTKITQHSPGQAFLSWLDDWVANLPVLDMQGFMQENGISPENVAVISADLIVGFCYEGALASPRIAGVVPNAAEAMQRAFDLGVRQFALLQEYHTHDALEFEQFGTHCIGGTHEAETVEALASLPFASLFSIIHKNTLHPALGTHMDRWLAERPNLDTFVAVGDCTDLCIYQLVTYLKLKANAAQKRVNVIVPANCVQTYDLPVAVAQAIGAMPHDGDLLHAIFLYHMALNGARVINRVV